MVGLVLGSYAGCILLAVSCSWICLSDVGGSGESVEEDGGDCGAPLTAATRLQIGHVPPKVNPYSETVFSVNFYRHQVARRASFDSVLTMVYSIVFIELRGRSCQVGKYTVFYNITLSGLRR